MERCSCNCLYSSGFERCPSCSRPSPSAQPNTWTVTKDHNEGGTWDAKEDGKLIMRYPAHYDEWEVLYAVQRHVGKTMRWELMPETLGYVSVSCITERDAQLRVHDALMEAAKPFREDASKATSGRVIADAIAQVLEDRARAALDS